MGAAFGDVVEKLRRSTVQVGRGGSGAIWSPDGNIVTNAHVVDGAGQGGTVPVELWDGRRFSGHVIRRSGRRDLAAVRIEASGLPSVAVGDSTALRVGELVIAVGNPLGFIGAASTGTVHGFENRSWVVSQLRLAPGNSGGPLANAGGEVVGINTMIAGRLAFAIPSWAVSEFLMAPREEHGVLGVVVRPIPMDPASRQPGLIVLEVIPRSPAEHASLGDVLVGAGGRRFQSVQDLEIAIHASRGGILDLQFRRGTTANIRTVAVPMTPASVRAA